MLIDIYLINFLPSFCFPQSLVSNSSHLHPKRVILSLILLALLHHTRPPISFWLPLNFHFAICCLLLSSSVFLLLSFIKLLCLLSVEVFNTQLFIPIFITSSFYPSDVSAIPGLQNFIWILVCMLSLHTYHLFHAIGCIDPLDTIEWSSCWQVSQVTISPDPNTVDRVSLGIMLTTSACPPSSSLWELDHFWSPIAKWGEWLPFQLLLASSFFCVGLHCLYESWINFVQLQNEVIRFFNFC